MKKIFIYNPESGNGKVQKQKEYILSKLREKYGKIEECPTKFSGHASQIAKESCKDCDYIFACGGDGTLNEIINGIAEQENKPIIGYIPTGTVNDVARSLEIKRNIKKATQNLLDGEVFEHDIFKANSRYGIYVCCAGLFTKSSYDTKRESKRKFGKIAYFFKGAKEVFGAKPVEVELEVDGEKIKQSVSLALILNSKSVAGIKLNKKAKLNDGKVEVVLVHSHRNRITFVELLRCLNLFIFGVSAHKKNKHITYRLVDKFSAKVKEGTTINLDGEKSGEGSFSFEVIKQAVKIIAPKQK